MKQRRKFCDVVKDFLSDLLLLTSSPLVLSLTVTIFMLLPLV
jgi:hypothetical protein